MSIMDLEPPQPADPGKRRPRRKKVTFNTELAEARAIVPCRENEYILRLDLGNALKLLDVRQRSVYDQTVTGKTHAEIGEVLDLSARRIGQIQAEIFGILDKALAEKLRVAVSREVVPGRQRKHGMTELTVAAADLENDGVRRLLLADLLWSMAQSSPTRPLLGGRFEFAFSGKARWKDYDRILRGKGNLVRQAERMRADHHRMAELLVLCRIKMCLGSDGIHLFEGTGRSQNLTGRKPLENESSGLYRSL